MVRIHVVALLAIFMLASCGKRDGTAQKAQSTCASAPAVPGYLTHEQAVEACRANKRFSGPDVKRSNIQVTNH